MTRGSIDQEIWLASRRNGDLFEIDEFMATVIRLSLRFVVPLSYFLVPLDRNRTQTHELVSAECLSDKVTTRSDHSEQITAAAFRSSCRHMGDQGPRTEFDELEDELLKWITEWDEADDAVYAAAKASMIKLAKLKLELEELRTRLNTGGRQPKRLKRSHASHHLRSL